MYEKQEPEAKPSGIFNPYVPINLTNKNLGLDNNQFIPSVYQNLMAPTSAISYGPNVKLPLQQVYNINLPGPTGGHVEMNKIYENILPSKNKIFSATTLGERLQTYDYIRQILIRMHDGEDISLDDNGQNSILSYIKFMELNPNYYNPSENNPYKGLPYGLLIYRSCFPIKLNKMNQTIMCAKDSVGLNIRLYSLSCAEYYSYKFRQPIYLEYDVWREVAYYEYIRENIIKKKQSPNFPLLFAFFLSYNKKIDFFSLKKKCLTQKDMMSREYQNFIKLFAIYPNGSFDNKVIRPLSNIQSSARKLPDEIDLSLQLYSGTTLILVTEAPHHNLYQWTSRVYEKKGIVNKMISHGYHNFNVWNGILFQIISALYVMQIHGIYIRNMTIADNIYIKDLQNYGKPKGYWKYIIDGISYYIPNYGYIVLIDSNFKDIITEDKILKNCKREYKIYTSDIFGKKYSLEQIQEKIFENYRNIINTNSFTKEHTVNNVMKPPENIMSLLQNMMSDQETLLGKVLSKHFRPLMNNRIGTFLKKDSEIYNIREITGKFKCGDMAVEVIEENLYRWCLVNEIKDDGIIEIITRTNPKINNYITIDVRIESLKQYSSTEKIDQDINEGIILSEDELLETYIIGYS